MHVLVPALALLLPTCDVPARAASYPPNYRFQTIRGERASVHFHQGFETTAREAVALADEILARHEARYRQKVGRVQIVIVDVDDDPNGFASPLPFPLVTIRTAAPHGNDSFGNHEGWLRLALTHELAHVVHLEQARGLWGLGRHVFGRAPFLFPNSLAMPWMIEGLAVYEETEQTAFGRGRNPDSKMVLRAAALEGRFPPEDRAIYALDAWPDGQTPYLFGEAFLRRLCEQSGEETIPRMARQHAGQIVPFLDGRTVAKTTGEGLHERWKSWAKEEALKFERESDERRRRGLSELVPLTTRGVRQAEPRFSPDGRWIAYTSDTLSRFPQIRLVRPDGKQDHRLALRNGGSGLAWTPDGRELVYAELQVHRTFAVFGDLSAVEVKSGRVRRLTRGARAYDPDVSPDGRSIVFARRLGDRSDLFTVGIDGKGIRRLTASLAGVEWSGPRFDPRGDAIVASRLLPGGWLDVVLVDPASGGVRQLTHDRAKDVEPTWTPDGKAVVFRSDRDGVSNLYLLRLDDRSLARVTNVLGGAFQPSVSPDGKSLAFSSYASHGYDVVLAPLDPAAEPPADPFIDAYPAPRPDPPPAVAGARPYRPWAMLWPRFWSPWIEHTDGENRVGVSTGGSDALYRHLWAARATYGSESGRVDASGFYVYDRFRTTLIAAGQDTTDVLSDGLRRTRQLSLQAALPIRRTIRSLQSLSLTYRREREEPLGPLRLLARLDQGGIEAAWTLSSTRSYPYSISPVDGALLRLAWEREAKGLGSDVSADKATIDARYYLRVLGERDVLALRLGGGTTFRAPGFQRSFAVGGYPDAGLLDDDTNPAVLRGYPEDQFKGRRFAAANLEYRFPLLSPQRGWRSLPLFVRHLHGSLFFDAAHAWSDEFRVREMKTAAGASLGLDSALGFALPATAELTIAHGFAERGDTRVYLRLGLAF